MTESSDGNANIGFGYFQNFMYRNTRKLFWRNPVPIHSHPRLAEVVDDDVVAVVAVAVAGVVEGARHELVAGVPRRRHVEAGAANMIKYALGSMYI